MLLPVVRALRVTRNLPQSLPVAVVRALRVGPSQSCAGVACIRAAVKSLPVPLKRAATPSTLLVALGVTFPGPGPGCSFLLPSESLLSRNPSTFPVAPFYSPPGPGLPSLFPRWPSLPPPSPFLSAWPSHSLRLPKHFSSRKQGRAGLSRAASAKSGPGPPAAEETQIPGQASLKFLDQSRVHTSLSLAGSSRAGRAGYILLFSLRAVSSRAGTGSPLPSRAGRFDSPFSPSRAGSSRAGRFSLRAGDILFFNAQTLTRSHFSRGLSLLPPGILFSPGRVFFILFSPGRVFFILFSPGRVFSSPLASTLFSRSAFILSSPFSRG